MNGVRAQRRSPRWNGPVLQGLGSIWMRSTRMALRLRHSHGKTGGFFPTYTGVNPILIVNREIRTGRITLVSVKEKVVFSRLEIQEKDFLREMVCVFSDTLSGGEMRQSKTLDLHIHFDDAVEAEAALGLAQ